MGGRTDLSALSLTETPIVNWPEAESTRLGIQYFPRAMRTLGFECRAGVLGTLEALGQRETLADPAKVVKAVPHWAMLGFVSEYQDLLTANFLTSLRPPQRYRSAVERGVLWNLLGLFHPDPEPVLNERHMWVPIAELHHCRVLGARSTFAHEKRFRAKRSAKIRIFGSGGGVHCETTCRLGRGISLRDESGCVQLLLPVAVYVQEVPVTVPGETRTVLIARNVAIDSGGIGTRGLRDEEDACGLSLDEIGTKGWKQVPISLQGGRGEGWVSIGRDGARTYEARLGLDVGGIGGAITSECSWVRAVDWKYSVPLGQSYFAYRSSSAMGLLWSRGETGGKPVAN